MRRSLFLLAAAAALFFLPAAAQAHTLSQAWTLDALNTERAQRGLEELRPSDWLSYWAHRHSSRMSRDGELRHSGLPHVGENPLWRCLSESVGVGASPRAVEEGLMDSSPHRHLILDPCVDRIGVGIVERDGTYWVTVFLWGS